MCVAVLAPERLAIAVGSAVALRRSRTGPVAVVLIRCGHGREQAVPAPPPTLSAVRAAGMLRGAGHPATALWRLVRSDAGSQMEAAAVLALLSDLGVPAVLCISVRRDDAVEAMLARCSGVLAAAADESGHSVALAAEAEGDGTIALLLPAAGAALALPRAGVATPPTWVQPIDRALEMVDDIDGAGRSRGQALSAEPGWPQEDFDGSIGVV